MPEALRYVSISEQSRLRTQAARVLAIAVAVVALWVSAIILAPLAAAYGLNSMSSWPYSFFSYICHQIPERSFHIMEHPFAVCSRCFGVYFGLLIGLASYPLWRRVDDIEPLPRFWLFAALIPVGIDWSLGVFGIWENTQLSRFVSGLILGAACAIFIVPALVEIVRNLSSRRRTFVDYSS